MKREKKTLTWYGNNMKKINEKRVMTIKESRMLKGLTQQNVSDLLEIPLSTLKKWEAGDRNPPVWAEKLIIEKLNSIEEKC